jgi:hypothetical protein
MQTPKLAFPNFSRLGQDTEFFLWDKKKQEVIPSYKYFGKRGEEATYAPPANPAYAWPRESIFKRKRDKDSSIFSFNGGGNYTFYRDGLAVEFNTGPVSCRAWIWQDLKLAMSTAVAVKWPKRLPANLTFTSRPWVEVSPELMAEFPDDLKVLGCSPTLDAYTESQKVVAVNPLKTFFRTSGAHLHASFVEDPPEEVWAPFIKMADLLLGVPFTYIFSDDLEFKRRKLYGQAGEFRHQSYPSGSKGLEYRVLSSRLYNHPAIFSLFSGIWKYVLGERSASVWKSWDPAWEADIQEAINLGTPSLFPKLLAAATELINKYSPRYDFRLGNREKSASPELWDKLKALNLKGRFPDAGVINRPSFPEAHKGWSDYASMWEI